MILNKKIAAFAIAAAMMLSMAACSSSQPAAESSSADASVSSSETSSAESSVSEEASAGTPTLEEYNESLNAIMESLTPELTEFTTLDPSSEGYAEQSLEILKKIDQAFIDIAALTPSVEFADSYDLAKSASEKMTQAVAMYAEAVESGDVTSEDAVTKMADAMTLYMEAVTDLQTYAMSGSAG